MKRDPGSDGWLTEQIFSNHQQGRTHAFNGNQSFQEAKKIVGESQLRRKKRIQEAGDGRHIALAS